MEKADYDNLTYELSKGCNGFRPTKGPHEPEEIYQYFDYERIAEQDKNIERRAAALETLRRQDFDPERLAAAIERENLYYDQRQRIIDRTIDNAEQATCKVNGIPERFLQIDRERHDQTYAEFQEERTGGNEPYQFSFDLQPPKQEVPEFIP